MRKSRPTEIFIDICTQRDYLASEGARRCLNHEVVRGHVKELMALARWSKTPVVSCVDARREADVRGLPRPDCVVGTVGQQKLSATLLPMRVEVACDNFLCISLELLRATQQIIFSKNHRDPFTNPKLDRLLTELPADRFLVFGAGLEESLRLLTLGLMLRGRRVTVVQDACGWWSEDEGNMTLRQLAAKGCELVTTRCIVEQSLATLAPAGTFRRRSVA